MHRQTGHRNEPSNEIGRHKPELLGIFFGQITRRVHKFTEPGFTEYGSFISFSKPSWPVVSDPLELVVGLYAQTIHCVMLLSFDAEAFRVAII